MRDRRLREDVDELRRKVQELEDRLRIQEQKPPAIAPWSYPVYPAPCSPLPNPWWEPTIPMNPPYRVTWTDHTHHYQPSQTAGSIDGFHSGPASISFTN